MAFSENLTGKESSSARQRSDRTLLQKKELLAAFDRLPRMSRSDAALALGIPRSTLSDMLKNRHMMDSSPLQDVRKRKRQSKCQIVDDALLTYYHQASSMNVRLNRKSMLHKARELAQELEVDFKPTDGWFTRWKDRHGIDLKPFNTDQEMVDPGLHSVFV